jgi:hypothetical protein
MAAVLAVLFALLGAGAAAAQPLTLAGKFGYLSEYELSAQLAAPAGSADYSGPLIVKHVGLCSHDGPQQMTGEIRIRLAQASARVKATLTFNGRRCTFSGSLSEQAVGEMACPGASVPASLWSHSQ